MQILDQYLLFLAKTLTVFFPIILIIGLKGHAKKTPKPCIKLWNQDLLDHHRDICHSLKSLRHFQKQHKDLKKQKKHIKKLTKNLFVLDFDGDIQASQVTALRQEIDLILSIASKDDQVLLRLNSRGGTVTGYGLAASQIHRIRQAKLHLVIAVDQIAASGGYMIASLAHKILAAPFACIGSIGVAYELPNFYQFLHKRGIEYKQITAGKHKRTLTLFGENTKEGEKKVQEDAELTHELFSQYITQYRKLNIEEIATGETWPAATAHKKGLVDQLLTSDEYIESQLQKFAVLVVHTPKQPQFMRLLRTKASLLLQHLE